MRKKVPVENYFLLKKPSFLDKKKISGREIAILLVQVITSGGKVWLAQDKLIIYLSELGSNHK